MSIFLTTVLLATDGSEEASVATEAAVEISVKTGSELHVIHVYGVKGRFPGQGGNYPLAVAYRPSQEVLPALMNGVIALDNALDYLRGFLEQMPAIGHLHGLRSALCGGFRVRTAAVACYEPDLGIALQPGEHRNPASRSSSRSITSCFSRSTTMVP
jgi:hypothetical protein